jgi:cytochrome P450
MSFDPLGFFKSLSEKYGDVVHFRIGTRDVVLVNDPDLIREILNGEVGNFAKGRVLEISKHLLAEGLLTSEGELHRRQRQLVQPAFHNDRMAPYAKVMTDYSIQTQASWGNGETRDVAKDMAQLALAIAGKALFDSDLASEAQEIREALSKALGLLKWMMLPVSSEFISSIPPFKRRFHAARKRLDETIYRLISEQRAKPCARDNLLSRLLANQGENDCDMTDAQARDEVLTILLAGHETMGNALTWTWYLLSQNRDAEIKLHRELDNILEGRRIPSVEDLPRLRYTRSVLAESLRLCPPAWAIGRKALSDFKIRNYVVPARATLMLCQFLVHRDPRYFLQPERFYPERWLEPPQELRPKFAYFPFGGGHRVCIGESFAWMEGILLLASIASNWRLTLVDRHPVRMQPFITLRPKHGIRMILRRRNARNAEPDAFDHSGMGSLTGIASCPNH